MSRFIQLVRIWQIKEHKKLILQRNWKKKWKKKRKKKTVGYDFRVIFIIAFSLGTYPIHKKQKQNPKKKIKKKENSGIWLLGLFP